jgi:hypothetical protein
MMMAAMTLAGAGAVEAGDRGHGKSGGRSGHGPDRHLDHRRGAGHRKFERRKKLEHVRDYHLKFGKKFRNRYIYEGRHHRHWTRSYYWRKHHCRCYWCPSVRGWYYWCAAQNAYYPVDSITTDPPDPDDDGPTVGPDGAPLRP